MRLSASEKLEIIRVFQDSELGVNRTLEELGINRSTIYQWYKHYLHVGFDGLKPRASTRKVFWNKIPDQVPNRVVEVAMERKELSLSKLAFHITDNLGWFIANQKLKYYKMVC